MLYEQCLAICRETGDRKSEGQALNGLGLTYRNLGEARRAIEFFKQDLTICRGLGDRYGEGNALYNTAQALDTLGDRARAIANAQVALVILEQIEHPDVAKVRKQLEEWSSG